MYTTKMILGVDTPLLTDNLSQIIASINGEVIKTLPIKPEEIADNTNTSSDLPIEDQGSFERYKDNGAWKCPGQNITQIAEIRDNYIFEGWKNQEAGMIEKEWPFVLDDNITFDSQGGSAVAPIIGIVPGNVISEPENPIYENFIFRGGYKEAEYLSPGDFTQDTVNNNMALYAKWIADPTNNPNEDVNEKIEMENKLTGSPATGVFSKTFIGIIVLLIIASGVVLAIRARE